MCVCVCVGVCVCMGVYVSEEQWRGGVSVRECMTHVCVRLTYVYVGRSSPSPVSKCLTDGCWECVCVCVRVSVCMLVFSEPIVSCPDII